LKLSKAPAAIGSCGILFFENVDVSKSKSERGVSAGC